MGEEQKAKDAEQNGNDGNQEAQKAADDTVTIRKGEYAGLKTQLKQMAKQLEEINSVKAQEEAAKLKAAQDWEALDKKRQAEMEALKGELTSTRRAALTEKARSALLGAGMRAGLTADGALSRLPNDLEPDAIAGWVAEIQKAFPDEFKAPLNPIGAPSAGPTGKPTTDEAAALRAEWTKAQGKGPDALMAVKRRVDAYMMSHGGKNPLNA